MKSIRLSLLFSLEMSEKVTRRELKDAERFIQELRNFVEAMGGVFALYSPGVFWDALARSASRELIWLREAVRLQCAEILGGSYVETLMPLWPRVLQNYQLERHKESLRKHLDIQPRGWFCPSMAWEISLVEPLCVLDYEYFICPDTAMASALGQLKPVKGCRSIEVCGHVLRVLPCQMDLSDLWKMGRREELLESLQTLPENEDGWLVRLSVRFSDSAPSWQGFFDVIRELISQSEQRLWNIQWVLPGKVIDQSPSMGAVSLITALDRGLGLPDSVETCRELLNRRPESNLIHKRILHIHARAHRILSPLDAAAIDALLLAVMDTRYYKNLPGREGVRGIVNRAEAHRQLIAAEAALDKLADRTVHLDICDFLGNGERQMVVATPRIGFILEYHRGGILRTMDSRDGLYNWLIAQREDGEPVGALQDHLVPADCREYDALMNWIDDHSAIMTQPYDYQIKRHHDRMQIVMNGDQSIVLEGRRHTLRMAKVIGFKYDDSEFLVAWQITNVAFHVCRGFFASEILAAFGPEDRRRQYINLDDVRYSWSELIGSLRLVRRVSWVDRAINAEVSLELIKPAWFALAPLFGSAHSAAPDEFQGYRVVFAWDLELKGQESLSVQMKIRFSRARRW